MYDPTHWAAGTRQVAVTVTEDGEDPQEKPDGDTVNEIFAGLLLLASNCTNPALGEHATELAPLPDPEEAAKVIVNGSVVHVAFGVVEAEKTTEA